MRATLGGGATATENKKKIYIYIYKYMSIASPHLAPPRFHTAPHRRHLVAPHRSRTSSAGLGWAWGGFSGARLRSAGLGWTRSQPSPPKRCDNIDLRHGPTTKKRTSPHLAPPRPTSPHLASTPPPPRPTSLVNELGWARLGVGGLVGLGWVRLDLAGLGWTRLSLAELG